jgi:hypothetical protein
MAEQQPETGLPARFHDVFAVNEFRILWLAHSQPRIGDQLARVALPVPVYNRTQSASWLARVIDFCSLRSRRVCRMAVLQLKSPELRRRCRWSRSSAGRDGRQDQARRSQRRLGDGLVHAAGLG